MHVNTKERGFALIDALIAIFVTSVGIVGAMDLIVTSQMEIDYQRKYMLAGMLAAGKLEELDAGNLLPTTTTTPANFGTEYGLTAYNNYTYTVTSTAINAASFPAAAPSTDLTGWTNKVAVTVKFTDFRSRQHSITVTGIKTKRA